jgi:hypothetical protein
MAVLDLDQCGSGIEMIWYFAGRYESRSRVFPRCNVPLDIICKAHNSIFGRLEE